ncbi:MAG TPA: sigma-70 family RNA polymerase sigma factor [Longimicrobium sp.]|nr:sigma-70 family RNA polymerase sigma factor [Longimicrobium sp.]
MKEQPPGSETALLADVRQGSTDALGQLYARHAGAVYSLAFRLTGSREDAEDVVQDVFVGLPRALRAYDERGRFGAWLGRVAARVALMRLRSRGALREDALDAAGDPAAPGQADPVDRITAQRALQRLPDGLRAVFVLKEIEGYSHAEIGGMLGITPQNAAVRLSRAWNLLHTRAS